MRIQAAQCASRLPEEHSNNPALLAETKQEDWLAYSRIHRHRRTKHQGGERGSKQQAASYIYFLVAFKLKESKPDRQPDHQPAFLGALTGLLTGVFTDIAEPSTKVASVAGSKQQAASYIFF